MVGQPSLVILIARAIKQGEIARANRGQGARHTRTRVLRPRVKITPPDLQPRLEIRLATLSFSSRALNESTAPFPHPVPPPSKNATPL